MSHVDEGTLHAYLDGALDPAEAEGVTAHVAACPPCRQRLEEERALITRAGELLALAAPPARDLPPFRPGDVPPRARVWWQVRLPLAWAATVVLALAVGTYVGSFSSRALPRAAPPQAVTERPERQVEGGSMRQAPSRRLAKQRAQPVAPPAPAPTVTETVQSRPDAATALVARDEPYRREAAPAPLEALERARDLWLKESVVTIDSARRVLGADPLVVPGAPIEAIYRGRRIGYARVVIVEQVLDASTTIQVISARSAPVTLDQVVVSGQAARAAAADSLATEARPAPAPRPTTQSALFSEVLGPLSADSLAALRRSLRPLRP